MFRIKTQIMETRPFDVTRDAWRDMQRKAMTAVGEYWFREMLPKRFTPQARYTYKHRPRSRKYIENKKKAAARGKAAMGGMVDNVFTGALMQAIESSAVIRGFPTRVTVYLHGPSHLNIRFKSGTNQPNKPAEILYTTPQEAELLKSLLRREMLRQLRTFRAARRTTTV